MLPHRILIHENSYFDSLDILDSSKQSQIYPAQIQGEWSVTDTLNIHHVLHSVSFRGGKINPLNLYVYKNSPASHKFNTVS